MDRLDGPGHRAQTARPSRPFRAGHRRLCLLLFHETFIFWGERRLTQVVRVEWSLLFDCFGHHLGDAIGAQKLLRSMSLNLNGISGAVILNQ